MPTELVLFNDQAAIDGIRASGADQLILAPGNGYTGGHSWTQLTGAANNLPSSEYLGNLTDRLGNFAIDIHEYLDVDFSGTHPVCNSSAPAYMANLTSWLKEHNFKALVSEFGGSNNTMCGQYLGVMLKYLADNEEYIGWAGEPLWLVACPAVFPPCVPDYRLRSQAASQVGSLSAFPFPFPACVPSLYVQSLPQLAYPPCPTPTDPLLDHDLGYPR